MFIFNECICDAWKNMATLYGNSEHHWTHDWAPLVRYMYVYMYMYIYIYLCACASITKTYLHPQVALKKCHPTKVDGFGVSGLKVEDLRFCKSDLRWMMLHIFLARSAPLCSVRIATAGNTHGPLNSNLFHTTKLQLKKWHSVRLSFCGVSLKKLFAIAPQHGQRNPHHIVLPTPVL